MKAFLFVVLFLIVTTFQSTHQVSWYDLHGRPMANRKIFNRHEMTCAASSKYTMGEVLEVRAVKTSKKVVVTVTDRGDFERKGISLDLSPAAFKKLFPLKQGLGKVYIKRVSEK